MVVPGGVGQKAVLEATAARGDAGAHACRVATSSWKCPREWLLQRGSRGDRAHGILLLLQLFARGLNHFAQQHGHVGHGLAEGHGEITRGRREGSNVVVVAGHGFLVIAFGAAESGRGRQHPWKRGERTGKDLHFVGDDGHLLA